MKISKLLLCSKCHSEIANNDGLDDEDIRWGWYLDKKKKKRICLFQKDNLLIQKGAIKCRCKKRLGFQKNNRLIMEEDKLKLEKFPKNYRVCPFFFFNGQCRSGDTCRFVHPKSMNRTDEQLKKFIDQIWENRGSDPTVSLLDYCDWILGSKMYVNSPVYFEKLLEILSHPSFFTTSYQQKRNQFLLKFISSGLIRNDCIVLIARFLENVQVVNTLIQVLRLCLKISPSSFDENMKNLLVFIVKMFPGTQKDVYEMEQAADSHDIWEDDDNEIVPVLHHANVCPTKEELLEKPSLQKNRKYWSSPDSYIKSHFLLCKEDLVHAIRIGISDYLNHTLDKRDMTVYENATLVSITMTNYSELCFVFDLMEDAQDPMRLLGGSLVCLYPMGSTIVNEEPIIATICSRNPNEESDQLFVTPYGDSDTERLKKGQKYVVFESPMYFRAYEPVLEALIEMHKEKVPFQDVLCNGNNFKLEPPEYIKANPLLDLRFIMKDGSSKLINVSRETIPHSLTLLNESQLAAFTYVFSQKVACVVGPPGTGKTYFASKVAKTVAHTLNDRALVIICYTNHALDAFTELLIDDFPNLIRIGSRTRSENPKILKRCLPKLLQETRIPQRDHIELMRIRESLSEIRNSLNDLDKEKTDEMSVLQKYAKDFIPTLMKFECRQNRRNYRLRQEECLSVWKEGREDQKCYQMDQAILAKKKKELDDKLKKRQETNRFAVFDKIEEIEISDADVENFQKETHVVDKIESGKIEKEAIDELEKQLRMEHAQDQMHARYSERNNDILFKNFKTVNRFTVNTGANVEVKIQTWIDSMEKLLQMGIVWNIPKNDRQELIDEIVRCHCENLQKREKLLISEQKKFLAAREDFLNLKKELVLKNAPIICLTSTAAAMNRHILRKLDSPVFLFEEAGELLEGQVISCLHDNVEHLIMIGDEKQLRPQVGSYELVKDYNFDISLFERLVTNMYPKEVLTVQLRMRPEISAYVKPFYGNLIDHPTVQDFDNIAGMLDNVLFFSHNHAESSSTRSKMNSFEASMVAGLVGYLQKQPQYNKENITVITPYKGQMLTIQREIIQRIGKHHLCKVATIDDFQGLENEIVIISLVRSNKHKSVGFVNILNRIIVSLSRAKKGMYIFGNAKFLHENSSNWNKVLKLMKTDQIIKDHLSCCCQNHSMETIDIHKPSDFALVKEGGCTRSCPFVYDCGHQCPKICHMTKHIQCTTKCYQELPCGHKCKAICHSGRPHPLCTHKMKKVLPCGHEKKVSCSTPLQHVQCTIEIKEKCPSCGKMGKRLCQEAFVCKRKCNKELPCGHYCQEFCTTCQGKPCPSCSKKCSRILLCGHNCSDHACSEPCPTLCHKKCENRCSHNICCTNKCSEVCVPCKQKCAYGCKHSRCSKLCGEPCDYDICNKRCDKTLGCGHQCFGVCGEPCPPCLECDAASDQPHIDAFTKLSSSDYLENIIDNNIQHLFYVLPCNHWFELSGMDNHMQSTSKVIAPKCCPECNQIIRYAPRYHGIIDSLRASLRRIIRKLELEIEQNRKAAIKIVQGSYRPGHWYQCKCGEPYFIGECGGAMEESKCLRCKGRIGGTRHQLVEGNVVATSIDGSTRPAWPQ